LIHGGYEHLRSRDARQSTVANDLRQIKNQDLSSSFLIGHGHSSSESHTPHDVIVCFDPATTGRCNRFYLSTVRLQSDIVCVSKP